MLSERWEVSWKESGVRGMKSLWRLKVVRERRWVRPLKTSIYSWGGGQTDEALPLRSDCAQCTLRVFSLWKLVESLKAKVFKNNTFQFGTLALKRLWPISEQTKKIRWPSPSFRERRANEENEGQMLKGQTLKWWPTELDDHRRRSIYR